MPSASACASAMICAALVAVGLDDEVDLVGDELLGRGARHERLAARDQTERVDARDVGDRGARRAATELEQQPAVARGHPAGAEREVGAGLAGDVGDAVLVVDDRGAGPAGRLLAGRADRLEVLGEEVAVDVGVGDVAAQRRQRRRRAGAGRASSSVVGSPP